jgi:hypothetical protein
MAMSHKKLINFLDSIPNDPLATMLRETSLDTSFDYPAVQARHRVRQPDAIPLPLLCELFTDCFAAFTLPAKTDTLAGTFAAEWPTDDRLLLDGRDHTS